MEELLKHLRDPSSLDRRLHALKEVSEKLEDFRPEQQDELCLQLYSMVSEVTPIPLPLGSQPRQSGSGGGLLQHLLTCLITLSKKPATKVLLTQNNAFLHRLASWSLEVTPLPGETEELYLSLLDSLTMRLVVPFKPSFLSSLISNAALVVGRFIVLPLPLVTTPSLTSALAILAHLVDSSPICIRSIQQLPSYKGIWDYLCSAFLNITAAVVTPPASPLVFIPGGKRPGSPPHPSLIAGPQLRTHLLLIRLLLGLDISGQLTLLQYALSHGPLLSNAVLGPSRRQIEEGLILELAALMTRLAKSLEAIVGHDLIQSILINGGGNNSGSSSANNRNNGNNKAKKASNGEKQSSPPLTPPLTEGEYAHIVSSYMNLVTKILDDLKTCTLIRIEKSHPASSGSSSSATAIQRNIISSAILTLIASLSPTAGDSSTTSTPPTAAGSSNSSKLTESVVTSNFGDLFHILRQLEEAKPTPQLHLIYSAYHRIFFILSLQPSHWGKRDVLEPLAKVVASLNFTTTTRGGGGGLNVNTATNTAIARIFSLALKAPSLREGVLAKILDSAASIQAVLDGLLKIEQGSLDAAWCVVEVLGLLGDNSRNKSMLDLLLSALNSRGAAAHLAFALRSTHLPLVTRALSITATVAFSRDNIKELSEALVQVNGCSSLPLSMDPLPLTLSPAATLALSVVENALERAGDTKGKDGRALDCLDVVTLYEERMNLLELQTCQLKDQVSQTNDMNKKLSQLLSKNGRVMGMQLAELGMKETALQSLKGDVDKLTQTVAQQDGLAAEATRSLRSALQFKEKKLEDALKDVKLLEARVMAVEGEQKNLLKKLEMESAGRKKQGLELVQLRQALDKKDQTLKEEMKKVTRLEKDLVVAAEEQKRMDHLLAKEKQTVDVIRGILVRNGSEHV